jgi:hypothetical protein
MTFTARLVQRIGSTLQNARIARLGDDEKRATLTLLYGVALADGVLSAGEDEALHKVAAKLGATLSKDQRLPEAVAVLAKKPAALKLACLVVADAFFADADYDAAEKDFVSSFGTRFGLPANPLQEAVDALRKKKLDEAVEEFAKSI